MYQSTIKNVYAIIASICIVLLCMSCSKKESDNPQAVGKLQINLGISVRTQDAYSHLKAAEPDNFDVTLFAESGSLIQHYAHASEVPDAIELPEGNYYVVAHSNNNAPAAFENDYYYGESEVFTITAGQTRQVSLTCSLANIPVSVVYSADVESDFIEYETRIRNAGGVLIFEMDEMRTGYFNQGPLSIDACLVYTDGTGERDSINLGGGISDPQVGTHYEIHIEASLANGYLDINLAGDETRDTVIVVISDEEITPAMSGELMITEIMYNPSALDDGDGEYLEIYNASSESQNLNGLVIRRGSNDDLHTINSDVILAPGEYAVLANSSSACATVNYVYSSINLVNGGEEIMLNTYGTNGIDGDIVCRVDYGADNFNTSLSGSSLQLSQEVDNAEDALLGTNWCASTVAFSTGDNGTPGTANHICSSK